MDSQVVFVFFCSRISAAGAQLSHHWLCLHSDLQDVQDVYSEKFSACLLLRMARIHSGRMDVKRSFTGEPTSLLVCRMTKTLQTLNNFMEKWELCLFLTWPLSCCCHTFFPTNVRSMKSDHRAVGLRNHRVGWHCAHYGKAALCNRVVVGTKKRLKHSFEHGSRMRRLLKLV